MCRQTLELLRTCNAELDKTTPIEQQVTILWEACLRTRIALKHLSKSLIEGGALSDSDKEILEQFIQDLPAEHQPSRSPEGEQHT